MANESRRALRSAILRFRPKWYRWNVLVMGSVKLNGTTRRKLAVLEI